MDDGNNHNSSTFARFSLYLAARHAELSKLTTNARIIMIHRRMKLNFEVRTEDAIEMHIPKYPFDDRQNRLFLYTLDIERFHQHGAYRL
jgi:hypothetical protein